MNYIAEKVTPRVKYFLYLLLGVVLWQLCRMLSPYVGPILGATVLGITFYPVYRRLDHWMPKRSPTLKALLADFWVMFLLVVPFVLLTWAVVLESEEIAPVIKGWQATLAEWREGRVTETISTIQDLRWWLYKTMGMPPSQFRHELISIVNGILGSVSSVGSEIAKDTTAFLFNLLIMVITLFFVFRDGPRLYQRTQSYVPLSHQNKEALAGQIHLTIVGIVRGWFLTALAQGLVAMVGYFLMGVPAAALFGMLTAVASLIPMIGSALVWFPLGVVLMVQGAYGRGTFLLIYGACIVSLLDNFLRPYLVGRKVELPFLFLFFALLGGIEVWGLKGIIIGPVLVAITPVLLGIYRHYTSQPA